MNSLYSLRSLILAAACCGTFAVCLSAGEPRDLATLGKSQITTADVDLQLGRSADPNAKLPPLPEGISMATVDIIAKQRRALSTLTKQGKRIPDAELNKWLVENTLSEPKLSPDEALKLRASGAELSPETYRDFLAFRFSWQSYVQQQMNETNLTKHFKNQKKRFDGSRFRIEHAFIAVPPGESKLRTEAHQALERLREELAGSDIEFAAAAKKLSVEQRLEATSEPLWITGAGPVLPAVVDTVLKLKESELSPVFDSGQAVHVVRLLEIENGSRAMSEASEELRRHMLLYLLDYLAKQSEKELPLKWNEVDQSKP